jgi:CMP-N-acetylneuraminic acid synthetase
VPAREGSKGFPHKNRVLIDRARPVLDVLDNVILSTDDQYLINNCNYTIHQRPAELANDTASMRDVIIDIINKFNIQRSDIIVLLYLTYPQRTINDIINGVKVFFASGARSMLCRKEVKTHPYMCIFESGSQVVKHDLYRRQDYPQVYEISHFLGVFYAGEIKVLNGNLYNMYTMFMDIEDKIDVDYEKDLI